MGSRGSFPFSWGPGALRSLRPTGWARGSRFGAPPQTQSASAWAALSLTPGSAPPRAQFSSLKPSMPRVTPRRPGSAFFTPSAAFWCPCVRLVPFAHVACFPLTSRGLPFSYRLIPYPEFMSSNNSCSHLFRASESQRALSLVFSLLILMPTFWSSCSSRFAGPGATATFS